MKKISFALFVVVFGLILNSCNEPTPIGSELLTEDQVNVFFTDSVKLSATTVKEDSVLTYDPDPSVIYDRFIFGDYTDPIFGDAEAAIYAQLVLDFDEPDFSNATFDSLVLIMQYDSASTYGDLEADPYGLSIFRISGDVDKESVYFSNSFFETEMTPLVEVPSFTPMVTAEDTIPGIIDYRFDTDGDTIVLPPSLRITMPASLGEELMAYDEDIYTSSTNFVEEFKGLFFEATSETNSLLSFDISTTSSSALILYYTEDDTINRQYQYEFSPRFIQYNAFKHDFSGTVVDDFIDDTVKGDSLLFAQAMSGTNIKVELPDIEQLGDIIVNKAELEFTVAILDEDDPVNYPPMQNLVAATIDETDNLTFLALPDVVASGNFGGLLTDAIGPNGEMIQKYSMNISGYLQDILDDVEDPLIYLRAFPKQQQGSRVTIYGPGHSKYPMKLSLTYTKLN